LVAVAAAECNCEEFRERTACCQRRILASVLVWGRGCGGGAWGSAVAAGASRQRTSESAREVVPIRVAASEG
jgi:hypothetical protein